MKKSIYYLELVLRLNSRLFLNALAGVSDEQANERISDHNNPLIWIVAHTVWARYNMLLFLGKPEKNPYDELFTNFKAYSSLLSYPSVEEIKMQWGRVSKLLEEALHAATDEQLQAESPLKSPIGESSNGGTFAFLVQHESYDIGQMAFLKKFLTSEAMKY